MSAISEPETVSISWRSRLAALWPSSGAVREIAALDGLRAVAVLLVMMVHCCFETDRQTTDPQLKHWLHFTRYIWGFGGTGVHLFFVLSGFLLFLPYAQAALGRRDFPSTGRFYLRRILRIVPAYWASLLILLLVIPILFFRTNAPKLFDWSDFGLHLILLHNWSAATYNSLNGVYWTLAVEFQFYLLLPLIGACAVWLMRGGSRNLAITFALALLASGPAINLLKIGIKHFAAKFESHTTLLEMFGYLSVFGLGIIASFIYIAATEWCEPIESEKLRNLSKKLGVAGIAILAIHTGLTATGMHLERVNYFLFGLIAGGGYAGILLGVVLGWRSWASILSMPWLRFVGGISYSIYLWHYPLYERLIVPMAVKHTTGMASVLALLLGNIFILIPLCFASYVLVERPFMNLKRKKH
jgi:peptidoglycan/LPS O-acetylase OafA/YrhL